MRKKIHIIGIAGVAIAPIAKMLQDKGWIVTGSDESVFDPMLTYLKDNNIEWSEGFDSDRVRGVDTVLIGGGALLKHSYNVELEEAKKLGIKIVSFAEILQDTLIKENSIVVAGTYGKTTTSGMLAYILDQVGLNPSFMTGGQPIHFISGTRDTDSNYSVVEGDEFSAAYGYDNTPKFMYYKPRYTIITATQWDHLNLYTTEESFINAFINLVEETQRNKGVLILGSDGQNNHIIFNKFKDLLPIYTYGKNANLPIKGISHYHYDSIEYTKDYTTFNLYKNNTLVDSFKTQLIGDHNVENLVAALVLCDTLNIDLKRVKKYIPEYKGVRRRQEVRGRNSHGALIIDDLAHSAVKAKATLDALRCRFQKEKIIVIFDPHASSLSDRKSLDWYGGAFDKATSVFIPKVSVKKSTPKESRVYGLDIVEAIKRSQPNTYYTPSDQALISKLKDMSDNNTVIVFMSSGGWRGILEEVLNF